MQAGGTSDHKAGILKVEMCNEVGLCTASINGLKVVCR